MRGTLVERQHQLARLLDQLEPFRQAMVGCSLDSSLASLAEARTIVHQIEEALESWRKWESEEWYTKAHAYSEEALVPHTESLFDNAEEAQVIAIWFARAFLEKMERLPHPARWEDAQNARMLLLQAAKALDDFLRREAELPCPAFAHA